MNAPRGGSWQVPADERERVDQLRSEHLTVELAELPDDARVVVVSLAFGDEFWRVRGHPRPDPRLARVHEADLIVDGGARVTDGSRLAFLRRPIERLVYAV